VVSIRLIFLSICKLFIVILKIGIVKESEK